MKKIVFSWRVNYEKELQVTLWNDSIEKVLFNWRECGKWKGSPENKRRENWWNVLVEIMSYAINHFSNYSCIDVTGSGFFDKYKNEKENTKKKELYPIFGRMQFAIPVDIVIKLLQSIELLKSVSEDIEESKEIVICIRSYYQLNDEANAENRKPFEILYMLQKARPDIFSSETSADVIRTEDDIWQYLMAYQYEKQLVELNRLGFYRDYVTYHRNDEKFRGTLDVSRHIRQNFGRNQGKIAYRFRKKTVDNALNHLILRAYEYLRKNCPESTKDIQENEGLRSILTELRSEAAGYLSISDRKLCNNNQKKIAHPFYEPYERMRCLCLDIINGVAAMPDSEDEQTALDNGEIRGYLINANDLFETYIENVFQPYTAKRHLSVESQYCLILDKKMCIRGDTNHKTRDKKKGSVRPDFVFFKAKDVQCVIDVKNRPVYSEYGSKNIEEVVKEDVYKLFRDVMIVHCEGENVANIDGLDVNTILKKTDENSDIDNEKQDKKRVYLNELDNYRLIYLMLSHKKDIDKCFGMIIAPKSVDKTKEDQIFKQFQTFPLLDKIEVDIKLGFVPFLKYDDNIKWAKWKKDMDAMTDEFARKTVEEIAELK